MLMPGYKMEGKYNSMQVCSLQPTNDYKTVRSHHSSLARVFVANARGQSVLSGLSPGIILQICER